MGIGAGIKNLLSVLCPENSGFRDSYYLPQIQVVGGVVLSNKYGFAVPIINLAFSSYCFIYLCL